MAGQLADDDAVEPHVSRVIHGGHAAPGNLRLDEVPAVEQLPDRRRQRRIHQEKCRGAATFRAR